MPYNKYSDRYRELSRACQKRYREKRKRSGMCSICGKVPVTKPLVCKTCVVGRGIRHTRYVQKMRDQVFNYYGGYLCRCCGETEKKFLSLDHINGGGNKHRKQVRGSSNLAGTSFYGWLRTNNFPGGYQILCMNCNMGKYRNGGICPHKENKLNPERMIPQEVLVI